MAHTAAKWLLSIIGALCLASCGQGDVLRVDKIYINMAAVKGNPSAGYFTVYGGPEDVELLLITSHHVLRTELHETAEKDGVMTMGPIDKVPIPARSEVKFAPGGKHVMIWGVPQSALKRGTLPMTFTFSNGQRILVDAAVLPPGGKAE